MKKLIFGGVIVAGVLTVLTSVLGQRPDRRNVVYFDDMYRSVASQTQAPSAYFPNGETQQPPVVGTIPRGSMPLHYGVSEDEMIRAGEELASPFAADSTAHVARGQAVYQTYCGVCHGPGGQGDGAVAKRGYPPPPSLLAEQALNRKDGQMFHIITYGYKNMPSYAAQVDRDDRWHVIAYIRQLQRTAQQQVQEAQNDTLNSPL